MRAIWKEIRTTPHHDGLFGSVDQSYMPHRLFYWPDYLAYISGPFTTERAFIHGLISKSWSKARDNARHSYLADFFEEQLMRDLVADYSAPVFTHSDLQRKNILVEEVEGDQDQKGFHVSLPGWNPACWEYFAAFLSFKWSDDWCSKVVEVVNAWPAEAAMMQMIYRDLRLQ